MAQITVLLAQAEEAWKAAEAAEAEMQELQQERDNQSGGRVKALTAEADELAKRCI